MEGSEHSSGDSSIADVRSCRAVAACTSLTPPCSAVLNARRRTATPGPAALKHSAVARAPTSHGILAGPVRAAQASRRVPPQVASSQQLGFRLLVIRVLWLLIAGSLLLVGVLLLVVGPVDGTRSGRIAVFREFLRRPSLLTLPLPVDFPGPLPPQLRAAWSLEALAAKPSTIYLDRLEVPLTGLVLSDEHDIDDEIPLPIEHAEGGGTMQTILKESRRSMLYRASVPFKVLLANGDEGTAEASNITTLDEDVLQGQTGTLAVYLPDGRLLLQHTLDIVRLLPAGQHILVRLCYAVRPDGGPWDGALVSDCEYGHRSPLYMPVSGPNRAAEGTVEIVLRGRMDAYVHASEVTRGCSNCFGRPYGDGGKTGLEVLACGGAPHLQNGGHLGAHVWGIFRPKPIPGRCFGRPQRHTQAVGLMSLSLGVGCLALCLACPSSLAEFVESAGCRERHVPLVLVQKLLLGLAAGLALAALAAGMGLGGALQRAVRGVRFA